MIAIIGSTLYCNLETRRDLVFRLNDITDERTGRDSARQVGSGTDAIQLRCSDGLRISERRRQVNG